MTDAASLETGDLFARVACGIDGSDASVGTVRQVAQLVPEGAEVTLFGVANEDAAVSIGWPAMPIAHATKVSRDAIEAGIARAREVLPANVSVQSGIVTGPPAPLSVIEATVRDATVVAIGSHGHRRMPGILIGSVATALIHAAPCSVFLARPGTDEGAFPRSIVVGLDGSAQSRDAARHAAAIAAAHRREPEGARRDGRSADGLWRGAVDRHRLGRVPPDRRHARSGRTRSRTSTPTCSILGSRGLRGVHALGSVSERAAHRAGCSVLVDSTRIPA